MNVAIKTCLEKMCLPGLVLPKRIDQLSHPKKRGRALAFPTHRQKKTDKTLLSAYFQDDVSEHSEQRCAVSPATGRKARAKLFTPAFNATGKAVYEKRN